MEDSRQFVYQKFSEYYRDSSTVIPKIQRSHQREYGYLMLKERFMVRHRRFTTVEEVKTALSEIVPSDVYHSCAYYENPDYEMDKKKWLGSDIVFDIDADHIPTSCDKLHDEFICSKCRFTGRGLTPEYCPVCGCTKFETKTWPCEICIQSAREEAVKLIDILENDFGFGQKEIRTFFSGHRGYHVHIEEEAIQSLDALARKEIVDYIIGLGLDILNKNSKREKHGRRKPAKKFGLHDFGWNRRLKNGMEKILNNSKKEDLKVLGLKNKSLFENKDVIIQRAIKEGKWESIHGVSDQTWLKLADNVRKIQSAKIDTVVTTDIHRLIRMDGTLHGKTGLKKIEFAPKELKDFDPFTGAVAFKKGKVKVLVSDAPEFILGGETLGPFKKQKVELPVAAAVMLICKGRAEVIANV